jgi:N-acetyl-anhydromuramyl-L-alanine amidase AmpD
MERDGMILKSRLAKALSILVLSLTVCTVLLATFEPAVRPSKPSPPSALMAADRSSGGLKIDRGRWKYIVLHHSATQRGNAERFAQWHRRRMRVQDVGYHFVIGNGDGSPDGRIELCPRWRRQEAGAHCRVDGRPEYNRRGIGICLVGNFQQHAPTQRQMESLDLLVRYLQKLCDIADEDVVMHGDLKATECPGRYFRQAWRARRGGGR